MLRILIVDDQPFIRSYLKTLLSREPDIQVTAEAGSGQESLHLARTGEYDLLLLDIFLPDMTGFEVLKMLRQEGINLPVIIVTGHAEPQIAIGARQYGAASCVSKDRIAEDLVDAIRQAIPTQE
jgi:DNA-binding NarL/FixJ family response regulator